MKIILIFLMSFFFINKSLSETNQNIFEKIDLFSEVLNKINKEYVEEVDQGDGYCDSHCNTEKCNYDQRDCVDNLIGL